MAKWETAFEDIHEVAVRLAARRLISSQFQRVDREAQRQVRNVSPRQTGVKTQLYRIAFLDEAAKETGDDIFGFNLATSTDPRRLGIIYYVFATSATAFDGIRHMIRYNHTVNSMTALRLVEETKRNFTLEAVLRPGLDDFAKNLSEWGTTTFLSAVRSLTKTHVVPQAVSFAHRRNSNLSEFNAFFGRAVRFGATRQLMTFSKDSLSVPISSSDPQLLRILRTFCEDALSRRKSIPTPMRARVEKVLTKLLPNGETDLDAVASALATSARSLGRRLADEDTSYTAVLDELRRDLAMRYLEDLDLELSQIAWLLGYSEVTSLNHAFHRWTSNSPTAVRAQLGRRS